MLNGYLNYKFGISFLSSYSFFRFFSEVEARPALPYTSTLPPKTSSSVIFSELWKSNLLHCDNKGYIKMSFTKCDENRRNSVETSWWGLWWRGHVGNHSRRYSFIIGMKPLMLKSEFRKWMYHVLWIFSFIKLCWKCSYSKVQFSSFFRFQKIIDKIWVL